MAPMAQVKPTTCGNLKHALRDPSHDGKVLVERSSLQQRVLRLEMSTDGRTLNVRTCDCGVWFVFRNKNTGIGTESKSGRPCFGIFSHVCTYIQK